MCIRDSVQVPLDRCGQPHDVVLGHRHEIATSCPQIRRTNLLGQPPVHLPAMPEHTNSFARLPRSSHSSRASIEVGETGGQGSLTSWWAVSYTHLRAHETDSYLVCRLLLEKKKKIK